MSGDVLEMVVQGEVSEQEAGLIASFAAKAGQALGRAVEIVTDNAQTAAALAGTALVAGTLLAGTPVDAQGVRDSGRNGDRTTCSPNCPGDGGVHVKQQQTTNVRVEGDRAIIMGSSGQTHLLANGKRCVLAFGVALNGAVMPPTGTAVGAGVSFAFDIKDEEFFKLCSLWNTLEAGAGNPQCVVGAYSVASAMYLSGQETRAPSVVARDLCAPYATWDKPTKTWRVQLAPPR